MRSFADPDTHFSIEIAETSEGWDGARLNEPTELRCSECGASVRLTREPSPGIDELQHEADCSQRYVRSEWWAHNFVANNGFE